MAAPRLSIAARQVAAIGTARIPIATSARFVRPTLGAAGPSSTPYRALSTTRPTWKKSTKTPSSKASQPKSRTEVENIDYENPSLDQTLEKVGSKMEKAVEWARSIVFESVERGRGRVSPCESPSSPASQLAQALNTDGLTSFAGFCQSDIT